MEKRRIAAEAFPGLCKEKGSTVDSNAFGESSFYGVSRQTYA